MTIDWESPNWGGNVHLATNGSWSPDRHVADLDQEQ